MRGFVHIGEHEIEMEANALSPYAYRQVFHEDFLLELQKTPPAPDLFQKMGFIMAKQAELSKTADIMKLTESQFYEWLCQFDALDVITASNDISTLYLAQTAGLSIPKKEGD